MKTIKPKFKRTEVENSGVPVGLHAEAKKFAKAWSKFPAKQVQIEISTVRDEPDNLLIVGHFNGSATVVRVFKQMLTTSAVKIFQRRISDRWEANESELCLILPPTY